MGSIDITAELSPKGPAAAFMLTDDQVAAVGEGAKRFPAAATINGYRHRTTVTRMGGEYCFGFSKAAREAAQLTIGETVSFTLELDDAPREVELPPALKAAFAADPEAEHRYDALAYTHRKEYARWIAEAKQDKTRERRVAKALEMLRAGQTIS
jgi:hypothetical protein